MCLQLNSGVRQSTTILSRGEILSRTSIALLACILSATIACGRTNDPLCDICTTSATVSGTVRTTDGVPVAGATIQIDAYRDTCAGPLYGGSNQQVKSSSAGEYRDTPFSLAGPFSACIVVRVTPPAGSSLLAAADSGAVVRFQADYGAAVHDSTRVDVQLHSAP
jgi:hypothetical protein